MKRSFTALLLTATLLPTGTVLAAEQGNTPTAVEQVAVTSEIAPIPPAIQKTMGKLFALQPAFKQLHIQMSSPNETSKIFSVSLADDSNDGMIGPSAYLTFDMKTGELRSFDLKIKEWASEKKPSTALAKEKAEQFLISWLGAEGRKQFGEPTSTGSGSSTSYDKDQKPTTWAERRVQFPLVLNNIPVSSREFPCMEVDGAGHVVRFDYNPPNLKNISVPTTDHIRSAEDMKKQLITADNLALQYEEEQPETYGYPQKGTQKTKPVLRYDLLNVYGTFDAQTGKPINSMTGEELKQASPFLAPWKIVHIHPQGNKLITHSEKETAEILSKVFDLDFSQMRIQKSDMPSSTSREQDPYTHYYGSNQKDSSINVSVEKASGLITNASLDINEENNRPATVSKEEAFPTALAFIEKYSSPTAKELEVHYMIFEEEQPPAWADKEKNDTFLRNERKNHHFLFQERHEGIPIMDRSYIVTVDAVTGKVISFSIVPYKEKLSLPVPEGIVSKEKATESFLQNKKLKLEYLWPSYFGQDGPAPILTYRWEHFENAIDYVDAFTGNYVKIPIEWNDEE
ncbi:hypothetical protein DFP93_103126 [Aneurinibacillus soli]|uniref:Uncharacterized protein n=1 Tax=Aneurinibacillus soli TaxID=1500254 RepID=A0A0U5B342_9BACL|nr:YcdB/YcdC domain-containing protein [Aneurinibacillus soli]PYE62916.1 hypothetical protein DFP93_103126 [Aneurinibacillus soli]BAU29026.1 hypothetical protein CB4_03204 [Aneurinibacillus soli]